MSRLSRESIAQAAIAIADADGVDAVSMRRVAVYLGVGTMSLYHHVSDKRGLFSAMADAIMAEQIIPADELPPGWRAGLAEIGRRAHRLFVSHPWILESWHDSDRADPGASFLNHVEQTLSIVAELGFLTIAERLELTGLVDEYVAGHVMHNQAENEEFEHEWMGHLERAAQSGEFPHLAEAFADGPPPEGRGQFERGLEIVLDGIERYIDVKRREQGRRSGRSRPTAAGRAAPSPPRGTGPTARGRGARRAS